MVILELFFLAGLDKAINPKSKQTIGKRVRFGLTESEITQLMSPVDLTKKTGLGLKKRKKGDYTF